MYYRDADARLLAGQEEVDRKAPLLTEQEETILYIVGMFLS
jgi:hypothetical protein